MFENKAAPGRTDSAPEGNLPDACLSWGSAYLCSHSADLGGPASSSTPTLLQCPPPLLLCYVEEAPSSCSPVHPRKSPLRRAALCPLSTVARLTRAISTSLLIHVLECVENASWTSYKTSVSFAPSFGCTGCLESNTVLSTPSLIGMCHVVQFESFLPTVTSHLGC